MTKIPESVKNQIANPKPDIDQFLAVITGRAKPKRAHLAELFADPEIMKWFTENVFEKQWTDFSEDRQQVKQHMLCQIEYWHRMGYDYIRVGGGITFPTSAVYSENTAELAENDRGWADLHSGPIQSWEDFEKYAWPEVKDENLWVYEFVADNLPDGMGMFICPTGGFLETPTNALVGYESLATLMYDEPELVKQIFDSSSERIVEVYRRTVTLPKVAGFFQGDDMGFRTGTLFSPDFLKSHSLPGHKRLADLAHPNDKIYFMHSCGKLDEIMDYLIDEVKIDARHSFEDVITPAEEFYKTYGQRIGILGGLDLSIIASGTEQDVRKRSRKILDACMPNGRYAFGSGNSIANYSIPENVIAMFDEAYMWSA